MSTKSKIHHMVPALLSVLLTGFATADQAVVTSSSSALIDDVIIMAYSGPPLEQVSLKRYQEVADAGIEYLVPGNGTFNREQNLRALDLAKDVGIKILPVDMRLLPFVLKPDIDLDEAMIRQVATDYKKHPALRGYVVRDEPNANMFPALRRICDIMRSEDPAHEPLINLFPNYGTIHQLGVADYPTYVRSFVETVRPRLLTYDSYPLRLGGITIYENWYGNLDVVRREARKAKIPFLVFLQSEGIKQQLRVPNRADILWQINTVLAHGARGIGWFCFWTPRPDQSFPQAAGAQPPIVEKHHNAMIDLNGRRTELYGYVREANCYFKKAGRGLLGWDNTDVARFEAGNLVGNRSSPFVVPEGNGANVVVGTFKRNREIRVVITTARCEESAVFSLKLSGGRKLRAVFASIDAENTGGKGSLQQWSLKPGGCVILDLI